MIVRPLVPGLLLSLLLVTSVACGGGAEQLDATGVEVAVMISPDEMPSGAAMIDQENLKFIPNKVTVKLGDKLYLKNSETAIHTVTINGKNVSGNMEKDDLMAWTPPGAGTYKVTCDFHPQMKATIIVE